jgi:small Trp-rich protein
MMIWIYLVCFVLALTKWMGAGFLAHVSWWWLLGPLLLIILWFEFLERMLGMDKRSKPSDSEIDQAKRERINKQLGRGTKDHRH